MALLKSHNNTVQRYGCILYPLSVSYKHCKKKLFFQLLIIASAAVISANESLVVEQG